ncbi:MAG: hypothetical protein WBL85_06535 [Sedimentisphaerales bacterium]
METCFVIQPFDGGVYDKRYEDIFEPAIKNAGLEPYRVDRDPKVSIPIEDIERGIKNSRLCFAEITLDNPNVWFELGYAIANQKDVVLVCSKERTKFPFDIQHRRLIQYKTDSPSDFNELQVAITERIKALMKKEIKLDEVKRLRLSPIAETQGLKQHEVTALATIMQNQLTPESTVLSYTVKEDMNKAGFTDIAVSLALKSLLKKGMVRIKQGTNYDGEEYHAYIVSKNGEEWLQQNLDKLILQMEHRNLKKITDDIPF